jgi:hypothetical protein
VHWKTILIWLLALALFSFIAVYFTTGDPLFDFTAFWIAGDLTLNGQDPYSESDWIPIYSQFESLGLADNQTFLYPKPILLLFLPFGALPLKTASIIWLVLTQAAILTAVLMLADLWPLEKPARYLVPFLIGVFLFRPYLLTLNLGQLGGFFLLVLTGVLHLWRGERWLASGMLCSLLALKPSLGFPILALIALWLLAKKTWRFFSGLAIGGVSLLILGWFFDLNWIGRFLEIGTGKVSATFGYHPTMWGLAGFLCAHRQSCALTAGGVSFALFLGLFLWFVWRNYHRITHIEALALAIALALWVTPYLWAYDHLLLIIPLAAAVGALIRKNRSYAIAASLPVLLAVVSIFFLNVAVKLDNDAWSALVPLTALLTVGLTILIPPKEIQR